MITTREDIVGVDASILMARTVWQASGHESNFTDPLIDCKACKARFRQDQIQESQCPKKPPSEKPGEFGECQLTEARKFNLMFKTFVGPVEESATMVYLRPETRRRGLREFSGTSAIRLGSRCPSALPRWGSRFAMRLRPKQFIFRSREFEQMEIEFFCKPETSQEWYRKWRDERFGWYQKLGLAGSNLRLREHAADELSHYSKGTSDIEYMFPWGWGELEGMAWPLSGRLRLAAAHEIQREGPQLFR